WHAHPLRLSGAREWVGDLTRPGVAESMVQSVRPQRVIHCAALTDLDWCQSHADESHALHVDATRRLPRAAAEIDADFVLISTDSVFDGREGNYEESAVPAPLNIYAQTKLAGEHAATQAHPRPLIVRTCIYGWNPVTGRGLAEWIVKRLEARERVGGF